MACENRHLATEGTEFVPEHGLVIGYTSRLERITLPSQITNVRGYQITGVRLEEEADLRAIDCLDPESDSAIYQRLGDLMAQGLRRQDEFEHHGTDRIQWRERGRVLATLAQAVKDSIPYDFEEVSGPIIPDSSYI